MNANSVWVDNKTIRLEKKESGYLDSWRLVQAFTPDELDQAFGLKRELSAEEPDGYFRLMQFQATEIFDEIEIQAEELLSNYNTGVREVDLRPKSYMGKFMFAR